MTEDNTVPRLLQEIRVKLNFTQEQLAERLGVSFATVNRWENGLNAPQKWARNIIEALATEAGVSLEGEDASANIAPSVTRRRRAAAAPTMKPMEQMLWDAACSIRGEKDAAKFKDYLLPLLFLKRLSDVFDDEIDRLAEDYGDRATALEIVESDHSLLRFYVSQEARWAVLSAREPHAWSDEAAKPKDIGEHLTKAVRAVVKQNPGLAGVIDVVDFAAERNGERDINPAKLRSVVETFSDPRYRLGLADVEPDFLGRAYEYLLRKFAEGSGQSAGEFFTPTEVGFLMANILRPKPGEVCHDYACGSAGLLVKLQLVCKELNPLSKVPLQLTGQELQAESYAVAKMNGIIHDMEIEIARGDTMINPKFRTPEGKIRAFDIVVANPMWNQPFASDVFSNDPFDRFRSSGGITTGKGDWAWLQHTVACMGDHGRAAVVLDTGAVSRGSGSKNEDKERNIRKWFVDKDLIEGVVLLPDNLFYNTPAAGVIVILNKRKSVARKGQIVLVNASSHVAKGKPKNYLVADDIRSLASMFLRGEPIAGEVVVISQSEAAEADYNLSPGKWVSQTDNLKHSSTLDLINRYTQVSESVANSEKQLAKLLNALAHSELTDVRLIDSDIGPIGPDRDVVRLGDHIERPDYGFTASATQEQIGPKMLRITDIQDGVVDWDSVPYCACDQDSASEKRLSTGDVLVARIGATTGKSYMISHCPESLFASYLIRVRAKKEKLLPKFLHYLMQSAPYWRQIASNKGDRLKGGVNIPVLESILLPVPRDPEQQTRIVTILDTLERNIAAHKHQADILDDLFRKLLDQLVAGAIVVPNAEQLTHDDSSRTVLA